MLEIVPRTKPHRERKMITQNYAQTIGVGSFCGLEIYEREKER